MAYDPDYAKSLSDGQFYEYLRQCRIQEWEEHLRKYPNSGLAKLQLKKYRGSQFSIHDPTE